MSIIVDLVLVHLISLNFNWILFFLNNQIALGERENTISSIKVNNHESSVSLVETRDILNEEEERSFWLRYEKKKTIKF